MFVKGPVQKDVQTDKPQIPRRALRARDDTFFGRAQSLPQTGITRNIKGSRYQKTPLWSEHAFTRFHTVLPVLVILRFRSSQGYSVDTG